jgi:hypothetical protein
MPRPPRWFLLSAALLCGLAALWGMLGVGLSVALPTTPVWTMAGFEACIAIAGVLGLFLGLGYYRQAPGLALACIAGTILLASFLGHRGAAGTLGNFSLATWFLARIALGLVLAALSALVVLVRNRRSWPTLFKGVAFGALPGFIALMFGLAVIGYGRPMATAANPAPVFNPDAPGPAVASSQAPQTTRQPAIVDRTVRGFMNLPILKSQRGGLEAGRIVLLTLLGFLLIGLTSAGVHYVIKAFQLGAIPDLGAAPAAAAPARVPDQVAAASQTA